MPPSAIKPQAGKATAQADAAHEALLKSIAQTEGLPALGVAISRVVKLASSDSDAVGGLAHFVLADVALTQKMLRLANTVFYRNSSGTPVTTVSRAIFLLGFETVRTTALAMMLVDSMSGRQGAAVRHELAVAVASSLLARELARRTQYREAEEAAIAALFFNTGSLLVAAHAHELHGVFQELIERGTHTPSQAATELFGCNLEHLGESVLREWHIPETILHSLTPLRRGALKPARSREEWIQLAVSFSGEAARLIIAGAHALDDPLAATQREALLSRYGEALDLQADQLEELFASVADETELLTGGGYCAESAARLHGARAAAGAQADMLEDLARQQSVEDGVVEDGVVEDGAVEQGAAAMLAPQAEVVAPASFPDDLLMPGSVQPVPGIAGRHASGKPLNSRELLTAGVQDVTEMMASGRCGANEIIALVLETLYHALGCRFAAFCLLDGQTRQYRARLTFGDDHAARGAKFTFPAEGDDDVFLLALRKNADVVISDISHGRGRELIPAWHRALFPDAASLIILPLLVRENRLGLFYADRALCAPEGIPSDEAALIRTLKMQVVATLQAR
jgi:HD-like signal output (HDOD) protein